MKNTFLSVIIPTYNEEKRLPKTLKSVSDYLSKQSFESEIIVVDGGSTDKTVQIAEELKPEIKNLSILRCEKNQGKGYSVKLGMLNTNGDYRIFMDADNSTSIDQIEKMWPYFEKGYDIVIGSRDIKGAILDPPQPLYRRFLGKVFRFLVSFICGLWEIKDSQCGFKCFTKKSAKDIFKRCKINGFAFDVEVLVIAKKLGYKIKEVPVYWKNDPFSKVKLKNIVKMGLDLINIRINLLKGEYFKKDEKEKN